MMEEVQGSTPGNTIFFEVHKRELVEQDLRREVGEIKSTVKVPWFKQMISFIFWDKKITTKDTSA